MAERFSLPVPRDLGLRATVLLHGWYQVPPFHWDEEDWALFRAERLLPGRPVRLVKATQRRGPGKPLEGEILGEGVTAPEVAAARTLLITCLGVDQDLGDFPDRARLQPFLRGVAEMGAGRWMRGATLLEDVCKGISGTNIAWNQAVKALRTMATLGEAVSLPDGSPLHAWPDPQRLEEAGAPFLRGKARLGYRAESILAAVRGTRDGSLNLDALDAQARKGMDPSLLRQSLLAIRGVGPATAAYLMTMRGYAGTVSVDSTTFSFTATAHFAGRRASVQEIQALYAPMGEHAGRACWLEYWLNHAKDSPLRRVPCPDAAHHGWKLFNDGKYFEAHESWEEVWRALGGPPRDYYHSLIHLAVAAAHARKGNAYGAQNQVRKAHARLRACGSLKGPVPVSAIAAALADMGPVLDALSNDEPFLGSLPTLPDLIPDAGRP